MSNAAGAVSSVLMSLPLIAVPCLAVFGLPTMGPPTAEAEVDDSIELSEGGELGPASTGSVPAAEAAFAPIVDASSEASPPAAPVSDRSGIDPTSDHRGAAANRAVHLDAGNPVSPIEGASMTAPPASVFAVEDAIRSPVESADGVIASWENVVTKLTDLGVRDFHLTNGDVPGEFHFSCSLRESSGVTRRFEAEGKTSAAAADDVSRQVEQWLATR